MFTTTTKTQSRIALRNILLVLAGVIALAIAGVVIYTLATNQFIDLFLWFRDAAVLAYLFVFRVGLPIALLLGLGMWVERKMNPDAARDSKPLSERYPVLKRIQVPSIPARTVLAVTFIAILWIVAIGIAVARFFFGIGYTTNLSNEFPWGLWIGFDVVSGVALAAGGFVMAGTVHVFNLKAYNPIVRPAILTALLGYLLVIVGLLFDLGRWYNIWHVFYMWNIHSPMLEVAWCVILYTTVLVLEFSPMIFERFQLKWPLKVVRAITLPLVILGMCLSTLHQSSLGSLFLIVPEKINPLWYSPLMPVFFFISAVAVGLGMTIVESNLSARAFGRELESNLLKGLGRAAAVVLGIYLIAKIADLTMRGAWSALTISGFHTTLYGIEMILGVIVPMVVLATKRGRENPRVVFASGGLIVGGVILNRLNTSLLGWWAYANGGATYVPAWSEIWITVSIVSLGVVAFALAAKFLPLFTDEHEHAKV
ncbi:MAG: Ni/Fe-hydrogenase cytochrome b subunit [Chloroflexi bacterium]|nr:Ni/Fe-hydrogenase cytochrome b subunit [Chloroflexota bacterium]